jgi:putative transposase
MSDALQIALRGQALGPVSSTPAIRAALTDPKDHALALARQQAILSYIEVQDRIRRLPREFSCNSAYAEHLAANAPPSVFSRVPTKKKRPGVSIGAFYRWVKRYRKGGFEALADPDYKNKGRSSLSEKARLVAWDVYFGQKLSARQACEAVQRELPNLECSYRKVLRFLRSESKTVAVYAREGEKAFNDKCAPYLQRQMGSVWDTVVGDHMKHDAWVFNDLWDDRRGEAVRLWFTGLLEMASRRIVGYCWCLEPSSNSISSALRMAVAQFGPPRNLYIDNGKDWRMIGRVGLSPEASGVCERLGIKARFCLPFNAQAKSVERFFGTFHHFDAMWKPFYCGRSPENRPEDCDEALKQHELFRKGKLSASPLPLASEFVRLAAVWIREYNAEHRHSGRGMNGRPPDNVFDAGFPIEERKPVEPRLLDPLLWDRQQRLLSEGGCVRLHNARYEPADEASFGALFLRVGEDVLVACDPYNLGEAVALTSGGHFLGVLRAQKLLEQGPTSHDDVRAGMRLKRQARRAVKEYVESVSGACRALGVRTQLERLEERATGTDGAVARATPGARIALPAAPPSSARAPEFASDAVALDRKVWAQEDDDAAAH